jgi:DNA repair protein RecN (Recombination protein N)
MIKSLEIKDYALIEFVHIDFYEGLNIITGETGAGKSILIDALNLLLGERASVDIIRKGANKSIIEGLFDVKNNILIEQLLAKNEVDFYSELIIRREISQKGNRCFINDVPVTLNLLKEVGDLLVDLHGQHEHQSLLRTETHINFLDNYSNNFSLLNKYKSFYFNLKSKQKELKELLEKEQSIKEKKEFYQFQLNEIENINPQLNEDDILENELKVLENSERVLQLCQEIYSKLYDDENSLLDNLGEIKSKFNQLISIDSSLSDSANELETIYISLKEISTTLRKYRDKINFDIDVIEAKRERLNSINLLKKKYGITIENVLQYKEKIIKEINLALNFSEEIFKIEKEIDEIKEILLDIAIDISENRKKNAAKIQKEVLNILKDLGISSPSFEIKFKPVESEDYINRGNKKYSFNSNGIESIEFYISTNLGEDVKPLIKVASGGEVSRIMLALKTVLAKNDNISVLIFDEIDSGISGRIAQKVGKALFELANYHQIIVITHLPQIAAFANHHFVVEKIQSDNRSISKIRYLNEQERIIEIAKLLSGESITEISIETAKQLLNSK